MIDHRPRFGADTLHKEYPEPETVSRNAGFVLLRDTAVLCRNHAALLSPLPGWIPDPAMSGAQYLGHRDNIPCYALAVPLDLDVPEEYRFQNVRELAGVIPEDELAIAGLAVHILDFDRTTRYCGRCGSRTVPVRTERARTCPSCSLTVYARISPAVIVLIRNEDTILMVRGKLAPSGRYGLVAGFVEPGESIEHAVHREVQEETGITIQNLRYIASEPWPFPNSLMLGFVADYAGGTLVPDGSEIVSAGWFDRDHLPALPPMTSITYALIRSWLDGSI